MVLVSAHMLLARKKKLYLQKTLRSAPQTLPHLIKKDLHTTLCTLHPAPNTLHLKPSTLHPTPTSYTLHLTPFTLHPTPYTLHPKPYTPNPTTYTLHPKPSTPNLNRQLKTLYLSRRWIEGEQEKQPEGFEWMSPYTLPPCTLHPKPYTLHPPLEVV